MASSVLQHDFHTPSQSETLTEIDDQICASLLHPDEHLSLALLTNGTSNLHPIDIAPNQGKLLHLIARMNRCNRILEIGTLGGYSTIWLAKALDPHSPSAKVITLEIDEDCAKVARQNILNAGLQERVEVKVGPALRTLGEMARARSGGAGEEFDMVFIDADKENGASYVLWALEFGRVGTVIVIDNVVRWKLLEEGEVADTGMRSLFETIRGERRLDFTAVQTVGSKGWDGFAVGLVIG